jgi:hypothetical protein
VIPRKARDAVLLVHREVVLTVRAAHAGSLQAPPDATRARRFLYGFTLPVAVLRATWRDVSARARWREVTFWQVGTLALFALSGALFFAQDWRGGRPTFAHVAEGLASWYAFVSVVEWIIIAVSREFHDHVAHHAALATGLASVEPLPARLRAPFGWTWMKLKRTVRNVLLVAIGAPLFAVALLIPRVGESIYGALLAVWTAYWAAVFAIGNAPEAWEHPPPREPWFLRGARRATRVPVVGWLLRPYVATVAWMTRSVASACHAFEHAPYEATGLALARAVASIPGVYLFARPAFPVAASHALVGSPQARTA